MGKVTASLPFGARISVDVRAGGVLRRLVAYQERVGRKRVLLDRVAGVMRQGFRDRFSEGGDPRWRPLAASTILAKLNAGLPLTGKNGKILPRLRQFNVGKDGMAVSTNILIATGALRDSWSVKGAKGHVEKIDEASGTVEVGTNLPYAKPHQSGVPVPYEIVARSGKALRFISGGGATMFRGKVLHPGLSARPVTLSRRDTERIADATKKHFQFTD